MGLPGARSSGGRTSNIWGPPLCPGVAIFYRGQAKACHGPIWPMGSLGPLGPLGLLGPIQKYVMLGKWSKLSKRKFDGMKLHHFCSTKAIWMSKVVSDIRFLIETAENWKIKENLILRFSLVYLYLNLRFSLRDLERLRET